MRILRQGQRAPELDNPAPPSTVPSARPQHSQATSEARRAARLAGWVVLRPLQFLVYALSGLSPRRDDWWLFGSWGGKRYTDNAAALFRHVATEVPEGPRATWVTSDRSIVTSLRSQGFDAVSLWSAAGVWACLRGGVYVFDGYTRDITHWLSRGAKTVLLRHGVGMKRIERGIEVPSHRLYKMFHGNLAQRALWHILLPWHAIRPSMALATSEEHAQQAVEYFGIDRDRVAITGFPRHDVLFQDPPVRLPRPVEAEWIAAMQAESRPVFLFMPTFREGFRPHDYSWAGLDRAAGSAGVVVYVKLHFVDAQRGTIEDDARYRWKSLRWIDPPADPVFLYPQADGLITDFSSVAFDFMLLKKPIVYFVPDYGSFVASRSLYYLFDTMAPGPKCHDFDELSVALDEAVEHGIGSYEDQYDRLLDRFHIFRDGKSSARAFAAISRMLDEPS